VRERDVGDPISVLCRCSLELRGLLRHVESDSARARRCRRRSEWRKTKPSHPAPI
jgi:hypothetical protein